MNEAEAFSPGHVTGLFSIHEDSDPRRKGSLGAGFCVALGVTSRVAESDQALYVFDGQSQAEVPVSRAVVRLFFEHTGLPQKPLLVTQASALPVGCGFGTSGAGALSLVLALNALCGAPLAREEAAALAHLAELEIGTGLGTVIGELSGGMEIRAAAGAPGTGRVVSVPFQESGVPFFWCLAPCRPQGF